MGTAASYSSNGQLAMSKATVAMSKNGIQDLKHEIWNKAINLQRELEGAYLKQFIKVIDQNWNGASKDQFLKDFDSKITDMKFALHDAASEAMRGLNDAIDSYTKADAKAYKAN